MAQSAVPQVYIVPKVAINPSTIGARSNGNAGLSIGEVWDRTEHSKYIQQQIPRTLA